MYKLKNSLIAFAGLAALIGVIALVTPKTSYSQGGNSTKDVNVVNTPGVNVANTPTVNIANSPTVQAAQSGAWNVGIEGTPTVKVDTNLNPLLVRDVDNPAFQPFQYYRLTGWDKNLCQQHEAISIPHGKRLVIENVSGRFSVGGAESAMFLSINRVVGEVPAEDTFVPTQIVNYNPPRPLFALNQTVRLYVDPPTAVINLFRNQCVDVGGGQISITGHLVDLLSPVEQQ